MHGLATTILRITAGVRRRVTSWGQPVLPPDDQRRFSAGHSGGGAGRSGG